MASSYKFIGKRATSILEIVHSDLVGPMENLSIGGSKYLLVFVDDYSRKVFVYFLKSKDQVGHTFGEFKNMVENQSNKLIKVFRTDNGSEYVNKNLKDILKRSGIIHQTTIQYTLEQNGLAERTNRTLVERAKCLLFDAKLEKRFWAEAVNMASYLVNHSAKSSLNFQTPEELWSGVKPDLSQLQLFGTEAMIHVPKVKRLKWDRNSKKMLFMGFCDNSKGSRFYDPSTNDIIKAKDAFFFNNNQKIEENAEINDSVGENKILENDCYTFMEENKISQDNNFNENIVECDDLSNSFENKEWNKKFDRGLINSDFTRSKVVPCVYFKINDSKMIFLSLYTLTPYMS